jgi:hypothetical protein
MMFIRLSCIVVICFCAAESYAEEVVRTDDPSVKAILLDPKDGGGVTLALEYKFSGVLYSSSNGKPAPITAPISISDVQLKYKATGTVASSAQRNPKNFLEFQLDASYLRKIQLGTFAGGAFIKYETDQSFDNKQAVYGLQGTYGKLGVVGEYDFFSLDTNFGRVTPKDDAVRKAVIGNLDPYYRMDFELLYKYPLVLGPIQDFEYNYRYFRESSAPSAIVTAGLHRQQLSSIRFGLKNDLFIGYSSGKLPIDRKSDKTLQIGVSYKLQ